MYTLNNPNLLSNTYTYHKTYLSIQTIKHLLQVASCRSYICKDYQHVYSITGVIVLTSKQSKSTTYILLGRPLLEYASCVWDPHYDSHVLELEEVQHRAACWVCSDDNFNTSVTTLLSQLNWQTLQDGRKYAKLTGTVSQCY